MNRLRIFLGQLFSLDTQPVELMLGFLGVHYGSTVLDAHLIAGRWLATLAQTMPLPCWAVLGIGTGLGMLLAVLASLAVYPARSYRTARLVCLAISFVYWSTFAYGLHQGGVPLVMYKHTLLLAAFALCAYLTLYQERNA